MCCLVVEIIMFVLGVIGVARGKVSLTRTRVAIGSPARIAGAILLVPLPAYIGANVVAGVALFGGGGAQPNLGLQTAAGIVSLISIAVTLACFVTAIVICAVTAKPLSKRKAAVMSIQEKDLEYFEDGKTRDRGDEPSEPDERIER
jgi:hypothetical protein